MIVESALDAVVVIDATGCIIDWNSQAANTFGWAREDVTGISLAEAIVPARYREAHKQGLRVFRETGVGPIVNRRIELSAMHRDGHEFPIEVTVSPIRHGGGWIFSSFIRDLTERKQAEQALAQLRRRSELILESVGEGIHGIDTDGRIIFENSAAAKLLGYTVAELCGKLAHDTMHHSRKDGTPFPVERCAIHAAKADGVTRTVEDEVFWRKDGSSFAVEYTTAPINRSRARFANQDTSRLNRQLSCLDGAMRRTRTCSGMGRLLTRGFEVFPSQFRRQSPGAVCRYQNSVSLQAPPYDQRTRIRERPVTGGHFGAATGNCWVSPPAFRIPSLSQPKPVIDRLQIAAPNQSLEGRGGCPGSESVNHVP